MPFDGRTYRTPTYITTTVPRKVKKIGFFSWLFRNVGFTTQDFLEWARAKDPEEAYYYGDIHDCAIAQFLKETGRVRLFKPCVGARNWGFFHSIPKEADYAAWQGHTFGGVAKILERLPA